MADANVTNMTKQLKYTGKGYLDYKMQPVNTFAELENKFKNNNELKLGMVVTVLNTDTDNIPVDYWYYHPYDDVSRAFDITTPPSWYPKPSGQIGSGLYWEDGAEMSDPDFEGWKDEGIE